MSLLLVVILAYADDIKVFATSYDEACRMTKFILQECSMLGLTIRASKCAVLSQTMRDIQLGIGAADESILAKANDRYLGVEVDHSGIDWRVYYKRVLTTYRTSLRWLSLLTHSWAPSARSTVYSTFAHPQLEYCAALFAMASLDLSEHTARIIAYHDIWEELQREYTRATCIILGQRSFNRSHYSILGWVTLPQRFLELLVVASLTTTKLIIPHIALKERYLTQRAINQTNNTSESFKQYCRRQHIADLSLASLHNRQHSIPRSKNGHDKILHPSLKPETQQHLVYWRKGMFAHNKTCVCGERFTLSHAERCFGTHLPMEQMIEEEKYDDIERYIAGMWAYMSAS